MNQPLETAITEDEVLAHIAAEHPRYVWTYAIGSTFAGRRGPQARRDRVRRLLQALNRQGLIAGQRMSDQYRWRLTDAGLSIARATSALERAEAIARHRDAIVRATSILLAQVRVGTHDVLVGGAHGVCAGRYPIASLPSIDDPFVGIETPAGPRRVPVSFVVEAIPATATIAPAARGSSSCPDPTIPRPDSHAPDALSPDGPSLAS